VWVVRVLGVGFRVRATIGVQLLHAVLKLIDHVSMRLELGTRQQL
jgi:hypothetical protein